VADIDNSGDISVLLCNLDASSHEDTDDPVPLQGCVRGSDFLEPHRDFSGDIIYLDRSVPEHRLPAVLTHELTHAATFSLIRNTAHAAQTNCVPDISPPVAFIGQPGFSKLNPATSSPSNPIPAWLNEAIAHCVEYQLVPDSDNLSERLDTFRRHPNLFPCVVPEGTHLSTYGRNGCRAAGMLFLTDVVMRQCPDLSLTDIAKAASTSQHGLEATTGTPFANLFRAWTIHQLRQSVLAERGSQPSDAGVFIHNLSDMHHSRYQLRGTAAVYLRPSAKAGGTLTITASPDARFQVTVVREQDLLTDDPVDLSSPSAI
jgi:hypothetical protein